MCYSCQSIETPLGRGRSVACHRGYDPYTQPTDFDLGGEAVEGFLRGDWGYVALTAMVVGADGSTLGERTLYGVAEWGEAPCAFENVSALRWVMEAAFERAAVVVSP